MVADSTGSIVDKSVDCIGQRTPYLEPFEFDYLTVQFVLG